MIREMQSNQSFRPASTHFSLYVLMFMVGATLTFDFFAIGKITLSEVIAFGSTPLLLFTSRQHLLNRNFKVCSTILILMFFGVIVSDLVNRNFFWFSARAFARPIFIFGWMLFFAAALGRGQKTLVYFVYGRIVAAVILYFRPSVLHATGYTSDYAAVVFKFEPILAFIVCAAAVF